MEDKKVDNGASYPEDTCPFGFGLRQPIPASMGPGGSIKAMSATLGPDLDISSTDTDGTNSPT